MTLARQFELQVDEWMPRILTQIDRDPTSSTYGCADRNWWHYKIRDFPSIILQQAGYAAYLASALPTWAAQREGLRKLSAASCLFWCGQVTRQKSFDEYYPWEQGYPPLAFSSLSTLKLAAAGVVDTLLIRPAAERAAPLLAKRFERQAANQQMAGTAALLWLQKVFPDLAGKQVVDDVVRRTLALQTEEGWFWEYGGPDLGYLSVTIDCLWDAYDATHDERFVTSAEKALSYIYRMTALTGANIGMHNARNTDYIVPYGLARFVAHDDAATREKARRLLTRLYGALRESAHFLRPTDDRYLCHYIGPSMVRALLHLQEHPVLEWPEDERAPAHLPLHFKQSGHVLYAHGLISLNKGGIITIRSPDGSFASDFGWSFAWRGKLYVTHWWSDRWQSASVGDGWRVTGEMVPCKEIVSSPSKHILLRLASRTMGSSLIRHLKKALIFRSHASPYRFQRTIHMETTRVIIEDRITGLPTGVMPEPAPRASRRHVASADSYHPEDFIPVASSWRQSRTIKREGAEWLALTTYSLEGAPS